MKQPIIELKFDQKLDQDKAWDFYVNQEFGGCNFWGKNSDVYDWISKMMKLF